MRDEVHLTDDEPPEREARDSTRPELRDAATAINFVADAGKQMLESSTSVSEVIDRLREFLPAVGLAGCAVDATMSSLILSYVRPGQAVPLTTMRELDVASPRLGLLAGTDALLDRVERGEIGLDAAVEQLRALVHLPTQSLRVTWLALLMSVAGWVVFLDGLHVGTLVVALMATALTFPLGGLVRRLQLPSLAATFLAAVVVAAIPNMLGAAGVSLHVGPAVVGALFIYLPGRAFVSSVIDGLANATLSSLSRGIQALTTAGFLALGMLVGNRIGAGLGLAYEPDVTATALWASIIGAALGVLGIAVAWSMPLRQLPPTLFISSSGWLIVALATSRPADSAWPAYLIAAGVVGVLGVLVAGLQQSSASTFTGVAILPLVPGFTLYTGMLAIAQGNMTDAGSALVDAGAISLAIAIGIALGIGVGRNTLTVGRRIKERSS
ncbi:MAG TPA: threonine/serine exporter family protein [Acidimicrobiales bacterium]